MTLSVAFLCTFSRFSGSTKQRTYAHHVGRWGFFLGVSCSAFSMIACDPEEQSDRDPPRVLAVSPTETIVPVDTTFTVRFSEPLNPRTIGDTSEVGATAVLVPAVQATEDFVNDLDNPPLSESRLDDILPITATLSADGDVLTVDPSVELEPSTAYALLVSAEVRDRVGNPLFGTDGRKATFRYEFTTDGGPPRLVSHDVVDAARPLFAPNRHTMHLLFDQPVTGLDQNAVTLTENNETASSFRNATGGPVLVSVQLDETRTEASLFFEKGPAGDGCALFAPSGAYQVQVSGNVKGPSGASLAPVTIDFSVGGACDETPIRISDPPTAIAGENNATIRLNATKPSTAFLRFGINPNQLDCLGTRCPVESEFNASASGGEASRFVHVLQATGLSVGVTYFYEVSVQDDVGFVAATTGSFLTAPLPKVSINEVMANPPASIGSENNGEYIEIANYGDVPVDLSVLIIDVDGGAAAGGTSCTIGTGTSSTGSLSLPAGQFAVIGGTSFDAAAYRIPSTAMVIRMTTSAVCGSFVNSRAQSFTLNDAAGRPLSSVSALAAFVAKDDGRSLERTNPDASDGPDGFCFSRLDIGPTPAAANGVTSLGCP